jgi:glycosyltransferase involved in cell wall biosynthesis
MQSIGELEWLITDAWSTNLGVPARPMRRLMGRRHPDIPDERVKAGGRPWLLREGLLRARFSLMRDRGWPLIIERNRAFDRFVCSALERMPDRRDGVFFAYSYACTQSMRLAGAKGSRTALGQIDGGPHEEDIVMQEVARYPALREAHRAAPEHYWRDWRKQCEAADRIIVNSAWSQECMRQSGIDSAKVRIVPLHYAVEPHDPVDRTFPRVFSPERPLRALFLGQVTLRKGVGRLFDAIRALLREPVEFTFVGPVSVSIPKDISAARNVRFHGAVDRASAKVFFSAADVFLLPTLSDGFAITQLEAQAFGVPVIATTRCGSVVEHGHNGLVLPEPTAEAIADALLTCLRNPGLIEELSANSRRRADRSMEAYAGDLKEAVWN